MKQLDKIEQNLIDEILEIIHWSEFDDQEIDRILHICNQNIDNTSKAHEICELLDIHPFGYRKSITSAIDILYYKSIKPQEEKLTDPEVE